MVSTDGTLSRDIIVFFGLVWQLGAFLAHLHHLFFINYICINHVVFRGEVLLVARLMIKVASCDRIVPPFK